VFEQHAQGMLDEQGQQKSYIHTVMQAIAQNLQGETPSIEAIAHQLTTSVRQLQRELHAQQASYQQLLDDVRKTLALEHLKNPHTSIYDVAFLLGFSEPSAFHRAFKRWTGETPRQFQRRDRSS